MRVGEDVCADVVGWEGDGRRGREWKGVLDGGMVGGEMGDTDAGEYEDDFDEEEGAYEDDFEEADEEFEGGGADEGLAALPEAGIAPRAVGADDDEEFQRFLVADEGASSSGLSLAEQIKAERLSRKEALSNQIQASMGRAGYVKSDERALPPRAQVLAGADVERPGSRHGARVGRGSSPGIGDEPAGDDGVSERRAMGVVPEARVRPPAPAEDEETLEAFLDGKAEILTREERRERIMQEAAEKVQREREGRRRADGLMPCPDVSGERWEDVEFTVDKCVDDLLAEVLVDVELGDLDSVDNELFPAPSAAAPGGVPGTRGNRDNAEPKRSILMREDLQGIDFGTQSREELRKALDASRIASSASTRASAKDDKCDDDDDEEDEDDPYAWLDEQETEDQRARRVREEEEDLHYAEAIMAHGLSLAPVKDTLSSQMTSGRRRREGGLGNIENLSSDDLYAMRTQIGGGSGKGDGHRHPGGLEAALKHRTSADGSARLAGGDGGQNDALHGARGRVADARLSALEDALL